MGKLLSGRYGSKPEAESIALSLNDCAQQLNMKPSDFVSTGEPKFFEEKFGSSTRYLLFLLEAAEVKESSVWKPGYYLLPLEAKDVLAAIQKRGRVHRADDIVLPFDWEDEADAPEPIKTRAIAWGKESQPLFFKCSCKRLQMRLYAPWAMRKRWKARLRCPGRCQPSITTLL